uniref:Uncharacterized protein n=1 Tax=Klebsiella pneumoniae TaxID=573 RepID=A0A1J0R044_KLEPN|nr:hypothetical protein [Klebsiella pneumoniae]
MRFNTVQPLYNRRNRVSFYGLIERIEIPGPAVVFKYGRQHSLRCQAFYHLCFSHNEPGFLSWQDGQL